MLQWSFFWGQSDQFYDFDFKGYRKAYLGVLQSTTTSASLIYQKSGKMKMFKKNQKAAESSIKNIFKSKKTYVHKNSITMSTKMLSATS